MDGLKSYKMAKEACAGEFASLVVINSSEEYQFLMMWLMRQEAFTSAWIGLSEGKYSEFFSQQRKSTQLPP